MANSLLDAVDSDKQISKAREVFQTPAPTEEQVRQARGELTKTACLPFDSPTLRNTIVAIKQRSEQTIDQVSKDNVLAAAWDTKEAQGVITSFKKFIENNKDQLTALQFIYGKPYARRSLTYKEIEELAKAIKKPPYNLNKDLVWQAYRQLEQSKVKGAGSQKLLTDVISLIRFTIGKENVLEPFPETVNRRFAAWVTEQAKTGRTFTPEQMDWLQMIKGHIATSAGIAVADLQLTPFQEKGGAVRADKVFGYHVDKLLDELNGALVR